MANRYRNLIYSTAEYTKMYNGFRGIELNGSSSITSSGRLAYAQNVYKDYDGDGANVIESVPGYRCFAHYEEPIHSLFYMHSSSGGDDHIIAHVGCMLMRHPVSDIYEEDTYGEQIASLEDTKSFGFQYDKHLYVMDGTQIYRINDDGECYVIGEDGIYPYVPTTYVSGEEYEQRNIMIDDFKEEYYVADPKVYLHASEGVKYGIVDPNSRLCTVKGVKDNADLNIYIPAYVNMSGINYKVVSIADRAFENNCSIRSIYLPDGLTEIGENAFSGCKNLDTVVTPSTIEHFGKEAFYNCSNLKTFYIGAGLKKIGDASMFGCASLTSVNYELNEEAFNRIEGTSIIAEKSVNYGMTYEALRITLPLHGDVENIDYVTVDGEDANFELDYDGEYYRHVTITFPTLADMTNVKIEIKGTLAPLTDKWIKEIGGVSSCSAYEAIAGCRVAEVFDGRVFLTGNPNFPNTVFYTERSKTNHEGEMYVGIYNYFNDGSGQYKVKSILAVRDMLAVFKEGDDGSGSIFYHKKEASSLGAIDTIYPVAYVHSGVCSSGGCLSFLDDPVFLTNDGLMALNHENINYQRNVVCRSHNVNYALLKEDLSSASLCEWLGYLVVGVNGKIFLADSRAVFSHPSGSREYEWFLLTDIGGYIDDETVFRYSSDLREGYDVHPTLQGEIASTNNIYSLVNSKGEIIFYSPEGGAKYLLDLTDEMYGGDFYPATIFTSYGKRLFFATDNGHICVFNNDMRGIAPPSVVDSDEYDEEEYARLMGNRIHPYYYSFDRHTPKYVLKTPLDDCGIPHLTKNTVKRSLVVKAKSYTPEVIKCEVVTDGRDESYIGSFPPADVGFDDFDFSSMPWNVSNYTATALPEREKRWIEKQIILYCDTFSSPISVYSISYRYTIKGKIKNNV